MSGPPPASVALVWSGDDQSAESLAPHFADLLAHGWDAHLLCERDDPMLLRELVDLPRGVLRARVHPPPLPLRSPTPRPKLLLGALQAAARQPGTTLREVGGAPDPLVRYLRAALIACSPAVVHLASPLANERYGGVVSALGARTIASLAGDGAWPLALADSRRLYHCLRHADAVHTETEALAARLCEDGLGADHLVVIPPARDDVLLELSPGTRNAGALRILSIGPLTWAQGYEHALQAVALLVGGGIPCTYRIVGSGDFADAIAFARHQLGLERHVDIVEPAGRVAMREHLSWADALLSAPVVPRSPKVVLDGQAAGIPVVTTESLPDGADTVLVVPRRDPEALSRALASLAGDPELRRRITAAGRRAVATSMTTEDRLGKFRGLYRRVLERRPPRRSPAEIADCRSRP